MILQKTHPCDALSFLRGFLGGCVVFFGMLFGALLLSTLSGVVEGKPRETGRVRIPVFGGHKPYELSCEVQPYHLGN